MSSTIDQNTEILTNAFEKIEEKLNKYYFLVYDTKGNPRAAIKYIYDTALVLKNNGYNVFLLSEDKSYIGEKYWLGDEYDKLEILSIKEDNVKINIEDVLVIPEYYSNALPQLANIKAIKVMLVQQKDYVFETLTIGSKWFDFGIDKAITTTKNCKEYLLSIFKESIVYVNPPYIGDNFHPSKDPKKPYIAISMKDRSLQRKVISEFYIKYPNLRWISFKDMVGLSYTEFSDSLRECAVSIWADVESTFGTFPLESIKSNVPVISLVPNNSTEWIENNTCIWVENRDDLSTILGNYMNQWVNGNDFNELVPVTAPLQYNKETFETSVLSIFSSILRIRVESIKNLIEKINTQ